MLLETTTYLGPARILEVDGNRIQVSLPEGEEACALMALASPYAPVAGDVVLTIGHEGNYFVIGVLQGTGKTTFTVPGDLELRAPRGTINLVSGKGVGIRAPQFSVKAGKIRILARSIAEKFTSAMRRVTDLLQIRAGRMRTISENQYTVRAGRIVQRAKGDVKIDGKKINLG